MCRSFGGRRGRASRHLQNKRRRRRRRRKSLIGQREREKEATVCWIVDRTSGETNVSTTPLRVYSKCGAEMMRG